jgi:hypothetical protein
MLRPEMHAYERDFHLILQKASDRGGAQDWGQRGEAAHDAAQVN